MEESEDPLGFILLEEQPFGTTNTHCDLRITVTAQAQSLLSGLNRPLIASFVGLGVSELLEKKLVRNCRETKQTALYLQVNKAEATAVLFVVNNTASPSGSLVLATIASILSCVFVSDQSEQAVSKAQEKLLVSLFSSHCHFLSSITCTQSGVSEEQTSQESDLESLMEKVSNLLQPFLAKEKVAKPGDVLSFSLRLCDKLNDAKRPLSVGGVIEASALLLCDDIIDGKYAEEGPEALSAIYCLLGEAYLDELLEGDISKGLNYLQQAMDRGCEKAHFLLGVALLEGKNGIPKQKERGLKCLKHAADNNYREAQTRLGEVYMEGQSGVATDLEKAYIYLKRAADHGCMVAQFKVAMLLVQGVPRAFIDTGPMGMSTGPPGTPSGGKPKSLYRDKEKAIVYFAEAIKHSSMDTTKKSGDMDYLEVALQLFDQVADKHTILFLSGNIPQVISLWISQLEAQSESFLGIIHSLQASASISHSQPIKNEIFRITFRRMTVHLQRFCSIAQKRWIEQRSFVDIVSHEAGSKSYSEELLKACVQNTTKSIDVFDVLVNALVKLSSDHKLLYAFASSCSFEGKLEFMFYKMMMHLISNNFPCTQSDEWVKMLANLVVLNYGSLIPHMTPKGLKIYANEIVKRLKEFVTRGNIKLNNISIESFDLVEAIQQGRGTGNLLRTGVDIETIDPKYNWNSDKLLKYPTHPPEVKLEAFKSAKRIVHDSKGAFERIDGLLVSLTSVMKKVESLLGPKRGTARKKAMDISLDLLLDPVPEPKGDQKKEGGNEMKRHLKGEKKMRVAVDEFEEFLSEQSGRRVEERVSLADFIIQKHGEKDHADYNILIDLSEQKITGLSVEKVDLSGAIFDRAEIQDVTFSGCNLTNVSFQAASFRRVVFDSATLVRTDFTDSVFHVTDAPVVADANSSHLSKKLVWDMRVRKIAFLDLQFRSLQAILAKKELNPVEMRSIFFRLAYRKEVQDRAPRTQPGGAPHVLQLASLKQAVDTRDKITCTLPANVLKEQFPNLVTWCGKVGILSCSLDVMQEMLSSLDGLLRDEVLSARNYKLFYRKRKHIRNEFIEREMEMLKQMYWDNFSSKDIETTIRNIIAGFARITQQDDHSWLSDLLPKNQKLDFNSFNISGVDFKDLSLTNIKISSKQLSLVVGLDSVRGVSPSTLEQAKSLKSRKLEKMFTSTKSTIRLWAMLIHTTYLYFHLLQCTGESPVSAILDRILKDNNKDDPYLVSPELTFKALVYLSITSQLINVIPDSDPLNITKFGQKWQSKTESFFRQHSVSDAQEFLEKVLASRQFKISQEVAINSKASKMGGMFDTLKSHLSSLPSNELFRDLNPDQQERLEELFLELQTDKKKLFKSQTEMMNQVDQEYVEALMRGIDEPPDSLIGGSVSERLDMAITIARGRPNIKMDLREVPEKTLGKELFELDVTGCSMIMQPKQLSLHLSVEQRRERTQRFIESIIEAPSSGNLRDSPENVFLQQFELGQELEGLSDTGQTPLFYACWHLKLDIASFLLSKGASPSSTFKIVGGTILDVLCYDDRSLTEDQQIRKQKIIDLLIENKSPVNLFNSVALGRVELVSDFLAKPPYDLNAILSFTQTTLLHVAVANGHEAVVALLLKAGAETCIAGRDKSCFIPLQLACVKGHLNIVEMLISCSTNLAITDVMGRGLVTLAASKDHMTLARFLIDLGAPASLEALVKLQLVDYLYTYVTRTLNGNVNMRVPVNFSDFPSKFCRPGESVPFTRRDIAQLTNDDLRFLFGYYWKGSSVDFTRTHQLSHVKFTSWLEKRNACPLSEAAVRQFLSSAEMAHTIPRVLEQNPTLLQLSILMGSSKVARFLAEDLGADILAFRIPAPEEATTVKISSNSSRLLSAMTRSGNTSSAIKMRPSSPRISHSAPSELSMSPPSPLGMHLGSSHGLAHYYLSEGGEASLRRGDSEVFEDQEQLDRDQLSPVLLDMSPLVVAVNKGQGEIVKMLSNLLEQRKEQQEQDFLAFGAEQSGPPPVRPTSTTRKYTQWTGTKTLLPASFRPHGFYVDEEFFSLSSESSSSEDDLVLEDSGDEEKKEDHTLEIEGEMGASSNIEDKESPRRAPRISISSSSTINDNDNNDMSSIPFKILVQVYNKALLQAIGNKDEKVAHALLDFGADPNCLSLSHSLPHHPNFSSRLSSYSCLSLSVQMKLQNMVTLLLDYGANPLLPDPYGRSPIHIASKFGENNDIFKILTNKISSM
eukprot:TRINITY_DN6924_c0_g1_i1.p1 TRINITY_DN6924_c0_g1~~TRINITY_DN6924_c0_g1_i1.p1  ORF type:complete len:2225 (+),score=421.12 TRINITY_DN6924_c0_g1_i1:35-6709(+)